LKEPKMNPLTRRSFVAATAAVAAAAALPGVAAARPRARRSSLRVAAIGCGGRGTGAVTDFLHADPQTEVIALGDVLEERVKSARQNLEKSDAADRVKVTDATCFSGWDAYEKVLATDCDVVILATPPHFRPAHFAAAVARGKHVFMEKPVAVDGPGVRKLIAAAREAQQKRLCVVAGTQRRHQAVYLEAMRRLHAGDIGRVVSARCYWLQGGLWKHDRKPEWTDMEWQLRNWLYFTWLSGDHIVEQHVHNLDVINWGLGATPIRAHGTGGRQVRTGPEYGHIFDHFAIEYEYPDGVRMQSMCRQIDGCHSRVDEVFEGTEGTLTVSPNQARIDGSRGWRFSGDNPNPYVQEHADLIRAIREGEYLNEGVQVAESTLTAIMGRMAAYTGKAVTWEQALGSQEDLTPERYEWGPLPVPPVAIPGKTPLA
jgi:myo-inositol 2-dehydrogenase / D-chiro-inositol 1-dehydrogenase